MLLCEKVDLDLEKESVVYENALETIAYLEDVVKSIENRVLKGEQIDGLEIASGSKRRVITEFGLEYLEKVLGHDTMYKTVEKPIGITELEKILPQDVIVTLFEKNILVFDSGKPKVVVKKG